MTQKYKTNSSEEAILNAKCALLKATTMGMVATNAERIRADQSVAYTEEHFYSVSEDLRSYMESLEVGPDSKYVELQVTHDILKTMYSIKADLNDDDQAVDDAIDEFISEAESHS